MAHEAESTRSDSGKFQKHPCEPGKKVCFDEIEEHKKQGGGGGHNAY